MTFNCNGCGGEFEDHLLGSTLSYGNTSVPRKPDYAQHFPDGEIMDMVQAEHHRTLCPRCQHVMKQILLNSDLSDHWDDYDWSLEGDSYTEPYE